MQITNYEALMKEIEKLKTDIILILKQGLKSLTANLISLNRCSSKCRRCRRHIIENWYFPVMAYNGIKPTNSPLSQLTDEKNI